MKVQECKTIKRKSSNEKVQKVKDQREVQKVTIGECAKEGDIKKGAAKGGQECVQSFSLA